MDPVPTIILMGSNPKLLRKTEKCVLKNVLFTVNKSFNILCETELCCLTKIMLQYFNESDPDFAKNESGFCHPLTRWKTGP